MQLVPVKNRGKSKLNPTSNPNSDAELYKPKGQ